MCAYNIIWNIFYQPVWQPEYILLIIKCIEKLTLTISIAYIATATI